MCRGVSPLSFLLMVFPIITDGVGGIGKPGARFSFTLGHTGAIARDGVRDLSGFITVVSVNWRSFGFFDTSEVQEEEEEEQGSVPVSDIALCAAVVLLHKRWTLAADSSFWKLLVLVTNGEKGNSKKEEETTVGSLRLFFSGSLPDSLLIRLLLSYCISSPWWDWHWLMDLFRQVTTLLWTLWLKGNFISLMVGGLSIALKLNPGLWTLFVVCFCAWCRNSLLIDGFRKMSVVSLMFSLCWWAESMLGDVVNDDVEVVGEISSFQIVSSSSVHECTAEIIGM